MKTITVLLVLFSNLLLAQTTVIEYLYADKIPGSFEKNREFLIYDDEASFYYTDVDQQKGTPKDVIANFKMTRGAMAYKKQDQLNKVYIRGMYPGLGYQLFLVVDDKPSISWTIGTEKQNILGFNCTKAMGTFRGRKYDVWFTEDLPTSLGPWKLDGLPGLILKATDDSDLFTFEAISIIKNSDIKIPESFIKFMSNYDPSKIKSYRDYVEKKEIYSLDAYEALEASGDLSAGKTVNFLEADLRSLNLEKLFEWETRPPTNKEIKALKSK